MNQPAGWYTDPFNRAQERYWDGTIWTPHDRLSGSADQTPPPGLGTEASALRGPAAPAESPTRPTHRQALLVGTAAAALLLVGGAVGAFVVGGGCSAAASAAVAKAVTQSLDEQSADMSLDIQVSAAAINEHITGSGAFNFASHSGAMTITVPPGLSEQIIEDGSTVYVSLPSLGQVLPGKSWLSEDATAFTSDSTGLGSGFNGMDNPSAILRQLQSEGDPVTSLGQTTFNGARADEYSVTIPFSQLQQMLGNLSANDRQRASGGLPSSITEKIYVDDNGYLGGIVVPISLSFGGHSLSETLQMSLSNYGTPVSVTPPPASEVATVQQFEAAAGRSGGGGSGGLGNSGDSGNTGSLGDSGDTGNTGGGLGGLSTGNSGNTA